MPRWEHCSKCGKAYNPNEFTAEERLLQAIFGEHLCPRCQKNANYRLCTKCNEIVTEPTYFEGEPYHSKCLAEIIGQ